MWWWGFFLFILNCHVDASFIISTETIPGSRDPGFARALKEAVVFTLRVVWIWNQGHNPV